MRPPPPPPPPLLLLWPLLLQLGGRGAAAPPADSHSQLPAPENPKIRLYNTQQILSWEPVSLSNDTRPVLYWVQYKYSSSNDWFSAHVPYLEVNCTRITATECDFTRPGLSQGFPLYFNVSLRVRAELAERVSAWTNVPWFQHYRNVTIGPPENIWVTPGERSLIIRFSPPFDIHDSIVAFSYYVYYWEEGRNQQEKGPFESNSIVLDNLKPLTEYCLQVEAKLFWKSSNILRPGHLSNITCHETIIDASTKLQRDILIAIGTFLVLAMLAGPCLFLVLKYRGLIKYWFHSPPSIPLQIEEYLKDPAQPILEALDKDSSPKDDTWDSVSVVSFPEKE